MGSGIHVRNHDGHHHHIDSHRINKEVRPNVLAFPFVFLTFGISLLFVLDGAGRIAGIILTAVGSIGILLILIYCVKYVREKRNVSHFKFLGKFYPMCLSLNLEK